MGILLHETAVVKVHNWGLLPVQRWWRHPLINAENEPL